MTHALQKMRFFVFCTLLSACLFSFGTIANAAPPSNAAPVEGIALIASTYKATLTPKGTVRYRIGFKNTSKRTWIPGQGKLLVVSGVTRESWLASPTWISKTTPTRITTRVESGHIGYAEFTVEAPTRIGSYTEHFSLNIDGKGKKTTAVSLTVDVRSLVAKPAVKTTMPASLSASRLIQSGSSVSLPVNGRTVFRVGYKNVGTTTWSARDQLTLRARATKESYFADESWQSGTIVARIADTVKPGELLVMAFVINAPRIRGTFQERFALYQGDIPLTGTEFDIPLTVAPQPSAVLASAPGEQVAAALSSQSKALDASTGNAVFTESATSTQSMIVRPGVIDDKQEQEPLIRAGLFSSSDPIIITANKPFIVYDNSGAILMAKDAQIPIQISFESAAKVFTVGDNSATSTSPGFVRLSGAMKGSDGRDDQNVIFEIQSYQHRPSWNQSLNDNLFRGVLEVRYASATGKVWVINELQLEQYLKGIAESSNNAPFEYHKALMVAARTYAKYHINRGTKYASEGYTVRTTDADQVYRGYGAEMRLPNVARAVEETRGVMVLYNNLLAITPYFSQSDGRTRSWEEVWAGGPKGWLIGKDDPTNKGLPLLGHGVGMSARGAVGMALAGKSFEEILTYYYTGVELHRRY